MLKVATLLALFVCVFAHVEEKVKFVDINVPVARVAEKLKAIRVSSAIEKAGKYFRRAENGETKGWFSSKRFATSRLRESHQRSLGMLEGHAEQR